MGKEGKFRFINGKEIKAGKDTIFDWLPGQPSDAEGILDCVYVYSPTFQLINALCDTELFGVCEVKIHQNCIA